MKLKEFKKLLSQVPTELDESEIVIVGDAYIIEPEEGEEDQGKKLALMHIPICCITESRKGESELEVHGSHSLEVVREFFGSNFYPAEYSPNQFPPSPIKEVS